ncbi:lipoyl(octanoyl) transferase LipB [Candidatus Williamhamiltonella defendens]|uniref:lipoyl(octanoyl) transferase LipB n=1 Tax=Candidatus Williamhamiltonella defendens TaxID=138072 RepID=UPI00130E6B3F|nr:lipoyl(octanoyl) transferase LipB [Candidatus Hamiltonella defensa]
MMMIVNNKRTVSLKNLVVRDLGLQPYYPIYEAMRDFTNKRYSSTYDEIWLVEHPPVFTRGQADKAHHLLKPGTIPVIQSDRGGQITYHGPGQQILYVMIDLNRKQIGVREFVTKLENTVIKTLEHFGIMAQTQHRAPGVYVMKEDGTPQKICSIGLRIRKGCSFHGCALNVSMDLSPFLFINPCGYAGMKMIQMRDLNEICTSKMVQPILVHQFVQAFSYTDLLPHWQSR